MAYTPKHYYRAKDDLNTGDPNKRVRGSELSDEFESISSDLRKVRDELNAEDGAINEINVEIDNIKVDVDSNKTEINELRDDFENHDHALDDLSDVTSKDPKKDDLLVWTGQNWISTDFAFIETTLRFKGGIDMTGPAPASPENGDLWVNDNAGKIDSSWGEISGREVLEGKFVGWAESTGRWHLLGDMASVGVTKVLPATGVTVDDSKPAEPVVGLDRDELDKWYEPKFGKNTAFNKDFGTTAGTVAEGNHNHDLDYADINHDHQGVYEPVIDPKNTAFNKNFGTTSGTVSEGDHTHSDYADVDHDHNGVYEPVIDPKKTAFNKDFGTTAGTVAEGNHDHKLNDLSDVNAASPTRDDLLVWNGSVWEANDFDFIQTALNFKGGINVANAAPSAVKGDLYVNDTEGPASASWTGVAGRIVKVGNFIGYANSRWYLLGDMADIGVTDVLGGTGVSVDDSKPSEPVVSIDRVETDKWYASPDDILWEQNGNDIYYNSGNVGIGTAGGDPNTTGTKSLYLRGANPFGVGASLTIGNTGNGKDGGKTDILFESSKNSIPGYAGRISMDNRGNLGFGTQDPTSGYGMPTERMRIDAIGRVGIGGEPGTRSIDEAKALAKTKLTEWKAEVKKRTAEQPEASTQEITLEVTDGDFGVMPTEQALAEKLMSRAIGGGNAKLQVAGGRAYFADGVTSYRSSTNDNWNIQDWQSNIGGVNTVKATLYADGTLSLNDSGRISGAGNAKLQVDGDGYFSGTVNAGTLSMGSNAVYRTTGATSSGIFFGNNNSLAPCDNTGALKDSTVDLGTTGTKFKDAYFSGTVNAGNCNAGTFRGVAFYNPEAGKNGIRFSNNGQLRPASNTGASTDGILDLGGESNRFKDAYFSGTIYGKVDDVADHIKAITPTQIANWDAGTGGGGGATTDGRISDDQIVHWDQAYGWGNHASAGYQPAGDYLTPSSLNGYATESWVTSNYQPKGSYVQEGVGGTVSEIKIVVGATGTDPNTLYFVV